MGRVMYGEKVSALIASGNWLAMLCPPGYMTEGGALKPHPALVSWERAVAACLAADDEAARAVSELLDAAMDTLATGVPAARLDSAVDAVRAVCAANRRRLRKG